MCGCVSIFFLILGLIILALRRRNETKNQIDEFDDISSSEVEIYMKANDEYNEGNDENNEMPDIFPKDYSEIFI